MGSFGENLRREREMRGVTLEEISAATKISVRFLQCVENEEFAKLPGGIFVRSFIRSYARYLGLDEDAMLAEYQLLTKDKGGTDLSRLVAMRPPSSRQTRSPWRLLAVFAVAAVLLVAGFALWRRSRGLTGLAQFTRSSTPRAASQKSAQPTPTPPPAGQKSGSPPSGVPSVPQKAAGSEPASATAATSANGVGTTASSPPAGSPEQNGGLVLQIAATERSWVAVDADGKTVLQGVLEPGQVKTARAKNDFYVVAGNAQGVVLTLNGQTLKPLGNEGEVKSVRLTRDDLKDPGP